MMNEAYITQLSKALNALVSIPTDELNKLVNIAHPIKIKKKDYFIRAGEVQPWLGFVISGVFRCYYVDDTGAEYTKHFFRENDFMAANSRSFIGQESEYFFQALEDSTILKIDGIKSLLTHPDWQEVFAKEIERVHKIEERRVRQLLLEDTETRYLNFLQDFPGLENRIKQSHIASYIGVSPVSLSRIRAKFKSN